MDVKKLNRKTKTMNVPVLVLSGNTKYNSNVKNVKAYIKCYLNTSTIHGIKYIGEPGRCLIEKIFWFCVIVVLCSLCAFFITKTYIKWKTSPVIVSLETKETRIFEIPFPAVTVCPEVKLSQEDFNLTDYVIKRSRRANLTKEENTFYEVALLLCKELRISASSETKSNKNYIDSELLYRVYSTPLPIFENLTDEEFLGKPIYDSLSLSVTEEGVCLSFNMLPFQDIFYYVDDFIKNKSYPEIQVQKWSLENGYPPGDSLDSYPRRTFVSGLDGGLKFNALYVNHSQIDYLCENGVHGFKVVLHHPCELPNMDKYFRLPLDQAVHVAIKPIMIKMSKELINYNPNSRRCYFAKEKRLSFYKIYTQQNCLVECFINYTLEHCGCVPFWLDFVQDTNICGPAKYDCIKKSKVGYLGQNSNSRCDCLPSCTSLSYDIETSYTNWNWRELYKFYDDMNMSILNSDPQMAHFSKLVVYYKDMQFLSSKRHQLYDIIDLISNVGGLLGLFIGFSIISAMEVMYILTVRIICNINKYGRYYWSGEPQLVNSQ